MTDDVFLNIKLTGDDAKAWLKVKKNLGLKHNSEVVRHLIAKELVAELFDEANRLEEVRHQIAKELAADLAGEANRLRNEAQIMVSRAEILEAGKDD